jgi:hypothetical protein
MHGFVVGLGVVTADGTAVQTVWSSPCMLPQGDHEAVFRQTSVVLATGSYTLLVGLSENGATFQQIEAARLDISAERSVGYYQATGGVGMVLNSMTVEIDPVG